MVSSSCITCCLWNMHGGPFFVEFWNSCPDFAVQTSKDWGLGIDLIPSNTRHDISAGLEGCDIIRELQGVSIFWIWTALAFDEYWRLHSFGEGTSGFSEVFLSQGILVFFWGLDGGETGSMECRNCNKRYPVWLYNALFCFRRCRIVWLHSCISGRFTEWRLSFKL